MCAAAPFAWFTKISQGQLDPTVDCIDIHHWGEVLVEEVVFIGNLFCLQVVFISLRTLFFPDLQQNFFGFFPIAFKGDQ